MSFKKTSFSLKLFLLLSFLLLLLTPVSWAGETAKIVVIHTNDLHGNLLPHTAKAVAPLPEKVGGLAYLATVIENLKAEYPGEYLLLDAGDFAQGTLESNPFYGKPVMEFFNFLGYDAVEFGNHEFDWGIKNMVQILKQAKF